MPEASCSAREILAEELSTKARVLRAPILTPNMGQVFGDMATKRNCEDAELLERAAASLRAPVTVDALDALADYDKAMDMLGSCGDGNCVIKKKKGQHTNGGCRCYTDQSRARRAMACASYLRHRLTDALTSPEGK